MRPRASWRIGLALAGPAAWAIAAGCSSFSGESASPGPTEAGSEAAADAGSAPVEAGFCASEAGANALLCADFDDGPVTLKFQGKYENGGTVGVTPSERSAPNAFFSLVDKYPVILVPDPKAADGGALSPFGAAVLVTTVNRGSAPLAVLEFDLRVDELPTAEDGGATNGFSGGQLAALGPDVDRQFVSFGFIGQRFYFSAKDPSYKADNIQEVKPPSGWFRVRIATRFDGTGPELFFNGVSVATLNMGIGATVASLSLGLGGGAVATTGSIRAAYDNVTLSLAP